MFEVFSALVLLLKLIYRMLGMTVILPGFCMCVDFSDFQVSLYKYSIFFQKYLTYYFLMLCF